MIWGALVLSIVLVEFWNWLFMDVGFLSTLFFDMLLYLSAPLVLVIFGNHSIRKRVSCRSKDFNFYTFSTCFADFVSSSFFMRLCYIFEAIWGSSWHHFWEKRSGNRSKNGGPPDWKSRTMVVSRSSQRRCLACALLNSNNCSSSNCGSNSKQYLFVLIEFSSSSNCWSNSCPNCCLSWLQSKKMKKWKESMSKLNFSWSDTPWAEARRISSTTGIVGNY